VAGCLALPAVAGATTRYAAPGGTAADTVCVTPDAPMCSIGAAAGGPNVVPADEAVILPGAYSEVAGDLDGDTGSLPGTVEVVAGNVHGDAEEPRPVLVLDSTESSPNHNTSGAFSLGLATTLSHIEIETGPGSTATSNLIVFSGAAVVDRVIARSSTNNAIVCNHVLGTIRNTACLSSGSGGKAIGSSSANPFTATINLRNVTAVSTGSGSAGVHYFFGAFGPPPPNITVSAKSVIAQGAGANDVIAQASGGATTTINLDHSNYDTATTQTATGGVASVTAAGSNNNITDAPLLDADGYHQLTGSPTINAGQTDGNSGSLDIDGQLRQIGLAAPDIGADEFALSSTTSVECSPGAAQVDSPVSCVATVSAVAETVTGSVSFASNATGSFSSTSCTLSGGLLSKQCDVAYTPSSAGNHQITASYSGDGNHEPSQGSTTVTATAPPTPPATGGGSPTSPTTPPKKKCKKKKKKHRAEAAKKKKCKKKKRR
jgi:hypothetical protein